MTKAQCQGTMRAEMDAGALKDISYQEEAGESKSWIKTENQETDGFWSGEL